MLGFDGVLGQAIKIRGIELHRANIVGVICVSYPLTWLVPSFLATARRTFAGTSYFTAAGIEQTTCAGKSGDRSITPLSCYLLYGKQRLPLASSFVSVA
jgi:hypothetical protein